MFHFEQKDSMLDHLEKMRAGEEIEDSLNGALAKPLKKEDLISPEELGAQFKSSLHMGKAKSNGPDFENTDLYEKLESNAPNIDYRSE